MSTQIKTYTFVEDNSSSNKSTWTLTYEFDDEIIVTGDTFTVDAPIIKIKYVGTNKGYVAIRLRYAIIPVSYPVFWEDDESTIPGMIQHNHRYNYYNKFGGIASNGQQILLTSLASNTEIVLPHDNKSLDVNSEGTKYVLGDATPLMTFDTLQAFTESASSEEELYTLSNHDPSYLEGGDISTDYGSQLIPIGDDDFWPSSYAGIFTRTAYIYPVEWLIDLASGNAASGGGTTLNYFRSWYNAIIGEDIPGITRVVLNTPPTFQTPDTLTFNKGLMIVGKTTASISVSSMVAKYGGYIDKVEFIIGNQTSLHSFRREDVDFTGIVLGESRLNFVSDVYDSPYYEPTTQNLQITLDTAGTFTPKVRVTDSRGQITEKAFDAITVKDDTVPTCTVAVTSSGNYYSNTSTYSVNITSATAYNGKSISSIVLTVGNKTATRTNNGTLSLTVPTVSSTTSYTPTVVITDNYGASKTYTLDNISVRANTAPTLTATVISSGNYYSDRSDYIIDITNAISYEAKTISSIVLTVGNRTASRSTNGMLSLTVPTVSSTTSYTPTVVITDNIGASKSYNLTAISVRPDTPPSYTATVTSSGNYYAGATPYTVSITNATAYESKTISQTKLTIGNQTVTGTGNGTLSITPSVTGSFTPTVEVTDNIGAKTTQTLTAITVKANTVPTCTIAVDSSGPYYVGCQVYAVHITNATAYEGKTITSVVLKVGSQTQSGSLINGEVNIAIIPSSAGSFTPTVTITDNIGASTVYTLSVITVNPLLSDITQFKAERIDSTSNKLSDEGTAALITATFSYSKFTGNYLLQPTFKIDGTETSNITWYTGWTNSGGFTGAVNWSNYQPNSPVTLYAKATSTFATASTYTLNLICKTTNKTGTAALANLPQAFYLLAGKAGGKALGIGKKPATDNTLDIGMKRTILNNTSDGTPAISYKGTQAQYDMIKFKDNTNDVNGNGLILGGGGLVVVGSGESADSVAATHTSGGDEVLELASDGAVNVWANAQNGATDGSTRKSSFQTNGILKSAAGFNSIMTGSGTTAQDKGSGVSPRYFPAKWTFNWGVNPSNGDIIVFKIPCAGHDYGVFLSTNNGTNYYPVILNGTSRITTHFGNGVILMAVFQSDASAANMYALNGGDSRVTVSGGCWRIVNFQDSTYYRESCYVDTAAGTAAKVGTMSNYVITKGYLQVAIYNANTAASAITLNINGQGAKPIYINGNASSDSNYSLPKGVYFVYYNGTNYYFRTDGRVEGASGKLMITGGDTMTGRLTMSNSPINQVITGTGTTAQDKGSGVSPRYFPAKWTFNTGKTPTNGDIITFKIPCAGHDYGVFLSINNGTNYHPVIQNGTSRITTHFGNGLIVMAVFQSDASAASMYPVAGGDARVTVTGGCWRIVNFCDSNNVPSGISWTAAATAAKTATFHDYYLKSGGQYFQVTFQYSNTYAGAITLNINGKGAKPIYINGAASSSSNYTLPQGPYIVYYDGSKYYFRTDDKLQMSNGGILLGSTAIDTALIDAITDLGWNSDVLS